LEKLPNFFIIGAPRAGTTTLYEYLKKIPKVYMSLVKEPQYFSPNCSRTDGLPRIVARDEYLRLFTDVQNEKAVGEASTSYLWDPKSAELICQDIPDAKIICILRDPIQRAFSHYRIHLRSNFEKQTFHEAIMKINKHFDPQITNRYLHAGLYSEQIQRYLNFFGKNQVKTVIFEEFIKNPKEVVEDILKFLDIDIKLNSFESEIHNTFNLPRGHTRAVLLNSKYIKKISSFLPKSFRKSLKDNFLLTEKNPEISKEDEQFLKNYYKDDVKKLEKILNRKLPWKNFI